MSFPEVDARFETFFEPTRVFLFGKEFKSIEYVPDSMGRWKDESNPKAKAAAQYQWATEGSGEFSVDYRAPGKDTSLPIPPKRLERTLRRGAHVDKDGSVTVDPDKRQFFARIYSFSYEGHYYRLPRPLLFLVNKPGKPVGGDSTSEAVTEAAAQALGGSGRSEFKPRGFPKKFSAKLTGVEARDWNFSEDILVWAVDRKDLAVCLDVEIGNYQEILLDSMIASDRRDEDRATRSRGDIIGRGAGSFRGDIIGPHQNK
jgi:hypothetical protein